MLILILSIWNFYFQIVTEKINTFKIFKMYPTKCWQLFILTHPIFFYIAQGIWKIKYTTTYILLLLVTLSVIKDGTQILLCVHIIIPTQFRFNRWLKACWSATTVVSDNRPSRVQQIETVLHGVPHITNTESWLHKTQ